MASSKGLPAGGHRGGAGTRWGQAGGVVLALGFTAGTGALASRWLWQTGRAGGRSTAGRAGGVGREGAAEWGGKRARGGELDGDARGGRSTAARVGREWSGEEWRNGQSQPAAYLFCGLFAECRPDTTLGNVF